LIKISESLLHRELEENFTSGYLPVASKGRCLPSQMEINWRTEWLYSIVDNKKPLRELGPLRGSI